ncbi:hypothetical protein [Microvirga yunnanensis]|uniref:hypothetical protein n=1 Tax=Microvirga yunnanensis TaxID=2953740 RepID=UPI0021C876B5|nr:hypothetical protein [Microvirga sp. HBU67655]
MADRQIAATQYSVERAVQAFPFGGKTAAWNLANNALQSVAGVISPSCSLFMLYVPAGKTVHVGLASQQAGKTVADARAAMFPLKEGYWTVTLLDAHQADLRFVAEASGAVALSILEAAEVA